ncbi:MAG: hypothetical protein ACOYK8_04685 [Alphaproteobacteria bacterium]
MKNITTLKIVTLLAWGAVFGAGEARAGAWTLNPGVGQVITSITAGNASSYYADNSGKKLNKTELTVYGEYGVNPWLTAIVAPRQQWFRYKQTGFANNGDFTSVEAGFRMRLWQSNASVFSFQLTGITSLRDSSSGGNNFGGKGVEYDVRGLYGYGISPFMVSKGEHADLFSLPMYVNAEIAFRGRPSPLSDEVRTDIALGIKPSDRWEIPLQYYGIYGLDDGYTGHKLQLSGIYAVAPDWLVQGGGYYTFAGSDFPKERGGLLAVWKKF